MTTGEIGEVTVDGKIVEVVTGFIFLGALITIHGLDLCDEEIRIRIAMGKAAMGGLTYYMKRQGNQRCHSSETSEGIGVPNSTVRSGYLDDESSR